MQRCRAHRRGRCTASTSAGRRCRAACCTEAPRGILYHRHVLDERGMIVAAQITPPTAQNQVTIEADLRALVEPRAHLPLNELTWQCEQAIRNYAPCISCSTHFLRVEIERM